MMKITAYAAALILIAAFGAWAQEPVTLDSYARAESDEQMKSYVDSYDSFGKFDHFRELYDVNNQITIRGNRDTLYSVAVFDLSEPLTITMPEVGDRYQSLLLVSQNHDIFPGIYEAGEHEITQDKIGTRYVFAIVRTFADPNDPVDMDAARQAQDDLLVTQADPGTLDLPEWDTDRMREMRDALNLLGGEVENTAPFFGMKQDVRQLDQMLGVACCWGGFRAEDANYLSFAPEANDGKTPHALTVSDVPVDGFWSVTLYDAEGFMPLNDAGVYSYNNVTAEANDDGSTTIHFGACEDGRPNCLPIVEGWNYLVRLYRPREEILDGSWSFPPATPME
ncbi:DUF1214 domain-containing protein [Afifella pfennigii]|uniref:DUF1214 domain-containing protein n=1 Tax=Afifella pfennigii TaxID=209897 RepID=UPI00047B4CC0|nr:DUF1214 domain-containing protein [Afifella pfennigii]